MLDLSARTVADAHIACEDRCIFLGSVNANQIESRINHSAVRARACGVLRGRRHSQPDQSSLHRHLWTRRQRLALGRGLLDHGELAILRTLDTGREPISERCDGKRSMRRVRPARSACFVNAWRWSRHREQCRATPRERWWSALSPVRGCPRHGWRPRRRRSSCRPVRRMFAASRLAGSCPQSACRPWRSRRPRA
jgi:hypothetical protein